MWLSMDPARIIEGSFGGLRSHKNYFGILKHLMWFWWDPSRIFETLAIPQGFLRILNDGNQFWRDPSRILKRFVVPQGSFWHS